MRVIADKRNETDGRDMEFLWRQDMDGMRQCSNDTHSIGWIWWFRNGRWIGEHQLSHLYMSHDVASDNNKYDKELLAFGWSIGSISVWYSDFRHSLIITKEWSIAHNKQTKLCLFVFRKKKRQKQSVLPIVLRLLFHWWIADGHANKAQRMSLFAQMTISYLKKDK